VTSARLARHAVSLLGPVHGPVLVVAPGARRLAGALAGRVRPPAAGEPAAAAVVAFLGARARPGARQATLREVEGRLGIGAPLVLLDHNQPRAWWRRALGAAALVARGLRPARARYPAARELAALGFTVEQLRLAGGERVQLVAARRRPPRADRAGSA
jgi:hypothetical protein